MSIFDYNMYSPGMFDQGQGGQFYGQGGLSTYPQGPASNGGLMGHGIGQGPGTYTGQNGPPGTGSTAPYSMAQSGSPEMPKPPETPSASFQPGDVSGFANYGMQAPALPDPMSQIKGLMSMATQPQQGPQAPMQAPQMGGLMQYLQAMSRG